MVDNDRLPPQCQAREPIPPFPLYLWTAQQLLVLIRTHLLLPFFPLPHENETREGFSPTSAMAATTSLTLPLLRPSPRQADATRRCAALVSVLLYKESARGSLNRAGARRSSLSPTEENRHLWRRPSSSGPTNPTIDFLVMFSISLTTRSSPSPSVSSLYLGDRRRLHRSSPPTPLRQAPAHGALSS
jgi:hypothetical protein